MESTNVISYSLKDFRQLGKLLDEQKDLTHFLVLSMVQNALKVINYYYALMGQQEKIYQYLVTASSNYPKLCKMLDLPLKTLANKEQLVTYTPGREEPAFWLDSYFQALKSSIIERNPIFSNTSYIVGLLARSVKDIHTLLYSCEDITDYLHNISQLLLNETSLDLFDLYTD